MPVVFRWNGYRHFFADEGDPREPMHIHVRKGRDNAKSGCIRMYPSPITGASRPVLRVRLSG